MAAAALSKYMQPSNNKLAMKKKAKKAKSKTKTASKTKRKRAFTLQHADMHLVKFTLPGPKATYKPHKDGRISYTDTCQLTFGGNVGIQNVAVGRHVHCLNQLIGAANTTENNPMFWSTSVFQLLVNRTTTGGGAIGSLVTPSSEAIYCSYQRTSMSLTNLENIAVHCEVYWCLPKKDSEFNPAEQWAQDDFNLALNQPTWVQPILETGVPAAGRPNYFLYGQDPTHNPYFKKVWKILKKKEFVLQSGNTLRMEFTRPINKLIRKPDVVDVDYQSVKGLTLVPLFIFKGAPVNAQVKTESATAPFVINYGPTKVGVIQSDTLIYHQVPEKSVPYNRVFSSNINRVATEMNIRFIDNNDNVDGIEEA